MSSQPITDPNNELKLLRNRLEQLEREVVQLRNRPLPQQQPPYHVRLVKTIADTTTYPAPPANTFEYVHERLSFTKTPGYQSQTFTQQSATRHGVGSSVDGSYLMADRHYLAIDQPNGQAFLLPITPHRFLYHAKLAASGLVSATAIETSVVSGTYWMTDSTFPVYNFFNSTIVGPAGTYKWQASLLISTGWSQPNDDTHHFARITFADYQDNTINGNNVTEACLQWPAKGTTPTFVAAQPSASVTFGGIFIKSDDTEYVFDIRPTALSKSTNGPSYSDFQVNGDLDIWRIDGP